LPDAFALKQSQGNHIPSRIAKLRQEDRLWGPVQGRRCAVKGISEIREGHSMGIESGKPIKQPRAAAVKGCGGEHQGKRLYRSNHVRYVKMKESEPLKKYRY